MRSRSKLQNPVALFFDSDIQDGLAAITADSVDARAQHPLHCRHALLSLRHRVGDRVAFDNLQRVAGPLWTPGANRGSR